VNQTERFYKIEQMLRSRGTVPIADFLDRFEMSKATFKRDLRDLRDRFGIDIVWSREHGGYRIDPNSPNRELPGLWFNASEIHALLTANHLLERLQPGLLAPHLDPLKQRIRKLIEKGDHSTEEVARRVRVIPLASRRLPPERFEVVAHAVLARKRLRIAYHSRGKDERTEREVSPQRLVHYRDNWYLDAWDHGKEALRVFAADAITSVRVLKAKARNIPEKQLDAEVGAGYGIFAGRKTHNAVLRFTPERARWVAHEQWHPKQKGHFEPDGSYTLEIPYSDSRELVLDILKYGPDVEVVAPAELRREVIKRMQAAIRRYGVRHHSDDA
jgi:predicted DNA-binding transcriptional regulator YafY